MKSKDYNNNHPRLVVPRESQKTKTAAPLNNGADCVSNDSNSSCIISSDNLGELTKNNETGMRPLFSEVAASTSTLAAQVTENHGSKSNSKGNVLSQVDECAPINSDLSSSARTPQLDVEFVGVRRINVKRVYLGGVKEGVSESKIKQFMEKKGIIPTC